MRGEIMGYTICEEIGKGGFGKVYKVRTKEDQKAYALKLEDNKEKGRRNVIINEIQAYNELQGCDEIPLLVDHGFHRALAFLVLPLFRYSLKDILERHPRFFTRRSATIVAKKLLGTIEFIHKKGRLYRDLKPENVMFDYNNKVYLIDFGMSMPYLRKDGSHIPEIRGKNVCGTLWYMSINTHRGVEQSRRDDLESLFYLLILLYKSGLPWIEVGASMSKRQKARTRAIKEGLSVYELCDGISGKEYLIKFFQYVRNLKFSEKPDYRYLNSLLDEVLYSEKEFQGYKEMSSEDGKRNTKMGSISLWSKFISILNPFVIR
ncbi:caseine kinase 1 [Encephalitozoon romaleae SJ-2008]|uniref:Caseine kinase 1 n=1 Tax=Encephalitozoon romaleae (strain SJ-2008) TaxID=1178016 RepID=I6ZLH6_ENCRO|nr:caseine kinase 1 [Encephalitozoon romaleae SJ-2008]AFN84168.1 caseine kinase 1 [Encephalitozoon romaleae SJ-2008]